MAKRRCLGCPALIPAGSYKGRCPDCNRQADKQRGSTTARGYGRQHQRRRAALQLAIDAGELVCCWNCGTQLHDTAWHLDHDSDRQSYRGPACIPCNLEAAGRASHGQGPHVSSMGPTHR